MRRPEVLLALMAPMAAACSVDALGPGPSVAPDAAAEPRPSRGLRLLGARAPGGAPLELFLDGPTLADPTGAPEDTPSEDLTGYFLAPAVIDGHTHLAYFDRYGPPVQCDGRHCQVQEALLAAGVAAAVDLAAPLDELPKDGALRTQFSGPILTAPGGYPTRSWGQDGYGLELVTPEAATAMVGQLAALGATWIKLPVDTGPALAPEVAAAAVQAAHQLGMRVAAHGRGRAAMEGALALDADLFAHAPTEPISPELAERWAPRPVLTTISTFSRGPEAQANLRILHDAGVPLLYGTDLGNGTRARIVPEELLALRAAGLTPQQVLAAATSAPAAYFGFDDLGALEIGKAACVLVLASDPLDDPAALADPARVIGEGCAKP